MHSDEPRGRNAGRLAPRRFSRPVYISSSTRTRHRMRTSYAHGRKCVRETHSPADTRDRRHSGFDRGNDVVISRPGLTAKIKNVRRMLAITPPDIIGAATKFLFSLIESIRRRHGIFGSISILQSYLCSFLFL